MKIAKTADRKKVMDTSKSTNCPKCGKETRIVKRMKDPRTRRPRRNFYFMLGLRVLREAVAPAAFVSSSGLAPIDLSWRSA